jgi:hypothetical protein
MRWTKKMKNNWLLNNILSEMWNKSTDQYQCLKDCIDLGYFKNLDSLFVGEDQIQDLIDHGIIKDWVNQTNRTNVFKIILKAVKNKNTVAIPNIDYSYQLED